MSRIFLSICLLFMAGCSLVQPVTVAEVEGLSDLAITRNGIVGEVVLLIDNPNFVTIDIESVDIDVEVNGKLTGHVELPYAQGIPQGESQPLRLRVEAETMALLALFEDNLISFLRGDEVEVAVNGEVHGGALGIRVHIPVSAKENLKIEL